MKKNKEHLYFVLALLCVWFPLLMGAWDKDKPASSTSLRSSNPEILANQSALETSFGNEHEFSTGGTNSGDHIQGSARSFSQATAPATQIDGGAFASTDLGSLWVDTDDNAIYILTATTPTWTPVSTEIIATLLGSARTFGDTLTITNTLTASAAATIGTTLDVSGNIDPTTYETTNGGFLDEDAMGSDAADKVASQQSIKAYVDNEILASDYISKAWGYIDTPTTLLTVRNISGVTNPDTGQYVVSWTTSFSSANYVVVVTPEDATNTRIPRIEARAAGSVTIQFDNVAGADAGVDKFNIVAFGIQ